MTKTFIMLPSFWQNKLECFQTGIFRAKLMFASRAKNLSIYWDVLALLTKLVLLEKILLGDKHSSLFSPSIADI